jgi:hypothetical protein
VIGNLTAVNVDGFKPAPNTTASCGLFVDHIIGGRQLSQTGSGDADQSGGRKDASGGK